MPSSSTTASTSMNVKPLSLDTRLIPLPPLLMLLPTLLPLACPRFRIVRFPMPLVAQAVLICPAGRGAVVRDERCGGRRARRRVDRLAVREVRRIRQELGKGLRGSPLAGAEAVVPVLEQGHRGVDRAH